MYSASSCSWYPALELLHKPVCYLPFGPSGQPEDDRLANYSAWKYTILLKTVRYIHLWTERLHRTWRILWNLLLANLSHTRGGGRRRELACYDRPQMNEIADVLDKLRDVVNTALFRIPKGKRSGVRLSIPQPVFWGAASCRHSPSHQYWWKDIREGCCSRGKMLFCQQQLTYYSKYKQSLVEISKKPEKEREYGKEKPM